MDTNNLTDKILHQIDAGFTKSEIIQNLTSEGFDNNEILEKLKIVGKTNKIKQFTFNRVALSTGLFSSLIAFGWVCMRISSARQYNELTNQPDSPTMYLPLIIIGIVIIGIIVSAIRK